MRPFATVFLGDRLLGETPFDPVQVPAGVHTARFVNTELGSEVSRQIRVEPGKVLVVKVNLADP